MSGHANHRSPVRWTPHDDRLLAEMRARNVPWAEVAKRLNRSEWSCRKRHSQRHARRVASTTRRGNP